jgi:hypothetical protein
LSSNRQIEDNRALWRPIRRRRCENSAFVNTGWPQAHRSDVSSCSAGPYMAAKRSTFSVERKSGILHVERGKDALQSKFIKGHIGNHLHQVSEYIG